MFQLPIHFSTHLLFFNLGDHYQSLFINLNQLSLKNFPLPALISHKTIFSYLHSRNINELFYRKTPQFMSNLWDENDIVSFMKNKMMPLV